MKLAYIYSTGIDNVEESKDDIFNKFIEFVDSMLSLIQYMEIIIKGIRQVVVISQQQLLKK